MLFLALPYITIQSYAKKPYALFQVEVELDCIHYNCWFKHLQNEYPKSRVSIYVKYHCPACAL